MPEETAQCGWSKLSEITGINMRSLQRRRGEMIGAGAIFYIRKGRRRAKTMCFFPSVIKIFFGLKAEKNTFI
jgi:hypothetical protein